MGSGFPPQNYWPRLQMCDQRYVYEEEPNPEFHNFKKPMFSNPTPISQIGSRNRLRQRNILRPENCLQFKRGHCKYGANCVFSHIPTLENSKSFNSSEEGQEMINRGRICYWGKECPYGDRCNFVHIRENVSVILVNSVAEDSRMGFNGMKRRRWENWGYGGRDMGLKNAVWRKTKICMKWKESGTCPYGTRCCFAHGEEELRQVDVMEPAAKALSANNLDIVTREAVSCKKRKMTVSDNREKDGKCYFKWNSIEKIISQVYADWIDDISAPVHVAAV